MEENDENNNVKCKSMLYLILVEIFPRLHVDCLRTVTNSIKKLISKRLFEFYE